MNLKDVLEAANYRISEGSEYLWKCYPDARFLDFSSHSGEITVSVAFSTVDQTVYEVIAEIMRTDYPSQMYRWINPDFVDAYLAECDERKIDPQVAFDDVYYVDIESDKNMLVMVNTAIIQTNSTGEYDE